MADWFRSWHGAPTDPKWRTIAKRAKVATSVVVAVAWALMDRASQNDDRGSTAGVDIETLADFLDCKPDAIDRVVTAMREKCVLTDEHFTAWEKRQPVREDGSAERARAWRAEQKRLREQNTTERDQGAENAADPPETGGNDGERTRTQPNANEHRGEERRLDLAADAHAREPEDLDRIERDLRQAAGLEQEPRPRFCDVSPILGLMDAGFDFATEILPVVRAKRRKGIGSWDYFVPMVHEARGKRAAAAVPRPQVRDGPASAARPTRGTASALAGVESYFAQTQDHDA